MFHHFHDKKHPKAQGSLSADNFSDMIEFLGRNNILKADEWLKRAQTGKLGNNEICLTFDDALRSQYDIALPVLENYGITAFWFVYSSVFEGGKGRMEVHRYFRNLMFDDVEDFYEAFFDFVFSSPYGKDAKASLSSFDPKTYNANFKFYTDNDRKFRFLRDVGLGHDRYYEIMEKLMDEFSMDQEGLHDLLWMNDACLIDLNHKGHNIGLHSNSHPSRMENYSLEKQKNEYGSNSKHLTYLLGKRPVAVSHPCGSYNDVTLKVLKELGVVIGFRNNMFDHVPSLLELPRKDHTLIFKQMVSL